MVVPTMNLQLGSDEIIKIGFQLSDTRAATLFDLQHLRAISGHWNILRQQLLTPQPTPMRGRIF